MNLDELQPNYITMPFSLKRCPSVVAIRSALSQHSLGNHIALHPMFTFNSSDEVLFCKHKPPPVYCYLSDRVRTMCFPETHTVASTRADDSWHRRELLSVPGHLCFYSVAYENYLTTSTLFLGTGFRYINSMYCILLLLISIFI